jgi:hypothetical protein
MSTSSNLLDISSDMSGDVHWGRNKVSQTRFELLEGVEDCEEEKEALRERWVLYPSLIFLSSSLRGIFVS